MESFETIKRRTTEIIQSVPQNMPSISPPSMPQLPQVQMPSLPGETFGALKRRTTDFFHKVPGSFASLPSSLPAWPATTSSSSSSMLRPKQHQPPPMKGTWERITVPPLLRSSHTIDVVDGTAYIFGGEVEPRQPVDNAMHAVTLPFSGATADYFAIKAVPANLDVVVQEDTEESNKPAGGEQEGLELTEEESKETAVAGDKGEDEDEGEETGYGGESSQVPSNDKGKGKAVDHRARLAEVPEARVGHATAVIGTRIFMFGGRGGPDMKALEEDGRVWVFDTRTRTWTYYDPIPAAAATSRADPESPLTSLTATSTTGSAEGESRAWYPAARSFHSAVATDRPDETELRPARRSTTWYEWAEGDSALVGTPQAPIIGNIAASATDTETDGYGTFIVHGGCLSSGGRAADVWAFDVRSRTWRELPAAPGRPRGGAALCLSRGRLYRFGGFNGEGEEGGQLDYLELGVKGLLGSAGANGPDGDVVLTARDGWESHYASLAYKPDPVAAETEAAVPAQVTDPLSSQPDWPGPRSVASLEAVTAGNGRDYLVLSLGERAPSAPGVGHAGAGDFWGDAWAFQVPPAGITATAVADNMWSWLGYRSGDGRWHRVILGPYETDPDPHGASAAGPGPRGWLASSAMGQLEDGSLVLWGGLNSENRRLGDGWILRLE